MTWILQAINGDFTGQEIQIDRDMLIGRHQAADIVLQAAEISRKHAGLSITEDELWLQDLGSSNGTFVNDARITQPTLLKAGDSIQFANFKFVLQQATQDSEVVVEKTVAEQMNEQGMPELKERDATVQLSRDGMPTTVGVPKPAPIPEGADLTAVKIEPQAIAVEQPVSEVEQAQEIQKNTSVGLITVITMIILAILAFVFLK